MNVLYLLFAFEKDDSSIRLIEDGRYILGKVEAIRFARRSTCRRVPTDF